MYITGHCFTETQKFLCEYIFEVEVYIIGRITWNAITIKVVKRVDIGR